MQHTGVDGDAVPFVQVVLGAGGLHRQLAGQDVDDLELGVPVPGQGMAGAGGVVLGVPRAGEVEGALGFQLPLLGREVERRVDAAGVQAHGWPPLVRRAAFRAGRARVGPFIDSIGRFLY